MYVALLNPLAPTHLSSKRRFLDRNEPIWERTSKRILNFPRSITGITENVTLSRESRFTTTSTVFSGPRKIHSHRVKGV